MTRFRALPLLALGLFAVVLTGCGSGSNALDVVFSVGGGGICGLAALR